MSSNGKMERLFNDRDDTPSLSRDTLILLGNIELGCYACNREGHVSMSCQEKFHINGDPLYNYEIDEMYEKK